MGPVVSKQQMETVLGYIETGKKEGARLVAGGGRANVGGGKGYFVEPTIFDGVTNTMRIAREEIFGPVLSVIPFKSVEAGIAEGNETTYGLAAAVWTRDVAKALKAARAIPAGTVWVNAYNLYDPALPFGGFTESGFGPEMCSVELRPGLVGGDVRVRPEPHHDEVEAARLLGRLLVLAAHRLEVGRTDVERVAALRRHARPG